MSLRWGYCYMQSRTTNQENTGPLLVMSLVTALLHKGLLVLHLEAVGGEICQ